MGELVYKGKGTNHGWDGTYKNSPQPVDVYTYTIKAVSNFSGDKINLSRNVTLFR
ncbi:MAG: gliding motility-associated C-terminal domain-containing protein [Chitinophagales bacterium]